MLLGILEKGDPNPAGTDSPEPEPSNASVQVTDDGKRSNSLADLRDLTVSVDVHRLSKKTTNARKSKQLNSSVELDESSEESSDDNCIFEDDDNDGDDTPGSSALSPKFRHII